ncbi:hypothetical protein JI58_02490 [Marinosulfonomonas sp. PRT-SC04]|nr:hypothetical protein JI58_02490 [Marinosulfonomonas sp. PRT-SC04]
MVCISALAFSTAGLFTKGVTAGAWEVIFWRGISAVVFTLGYALWRGSVRSEIANFRGPAIAVMLLNAAGTAAFIPAFKLTSIANVAMIWGVAPLLTALLAWLVLSERPSRRVMLGSLVAIIGVMVVVSGSIGGGTIIGDGLAFWMTLMIAGVMVVYRRWPDTPVALPNALASVILLPISLWISAPMQVVGSEVMILLGFGALFAVASVTLSMGARILPAAETALLSALETPLAPVLAFLVLSEMPTTPSMIGGTMIMVALVGSQMKR